jgi:RNA polymerase-binding transcription factor DksA
MSQNEFYKTKLEEELSVVVDDLQTIAVQNKETGDWIAIPVSDDIGNADENITADTVEEWNERRALMTQLEIRYHNIKKALKKIETGDFGICEISGDPIEEERLQVNPSARTNLANIDREKELPL